MPLVKAGHIVEDRFVRVLDDAPLPDGAPVLLPASRFLADARDLVLRAAPTGVIWPNDRSVAELAPYLDWLALVALVFPNFRDGRAYSQARLLRERHQFRGELRATGQVLRDQFLFLSRAGFDAFEVTKDADAASRGNRSVETVGIRRRDRDVRLNEPVAPGALRRILGRRHRTGHAHQPVRADHRPAGLGGRPGGQEADAVHLRHHAHRHRDVRVRAVGGRGPCAPSSRHSDSSSRRKFQHRVEQHLGAGVQVLRLGFLAHVVAEPADARHEDHAGGAQPRHHLRIVARA